MKRYFIPVVCVALFMLLVSCGHTEPSWSVVRLRGKFSEEEEEFLRSVVFQTEAETKCAERFGDKVVVYEKTEYIDVKTEGFPSGVYPVLYIEKTGSAEKDELWLIEGGKNVRYKSILYELFRKTEEKNET